MQIIDRFLIFFSIVISISAVVNVIYIDFFLEKRIEAVNETKFTYISSNKVDEPKLRPLDLFSRRPTQTVPKLSTHNEDDAVGSAFKVSNNIWLTARHVVDGCTKVFINENFDNEEDDGKLVKMIYIHPASDLAAFVYNNSAASFNIPTLEDDESKKSLLRTRAFTAGYPVGEPGNLYVKYLGKAALSNKNYDILEPIFVWTVSKKFPESLTTVGGISGSPMFNNESRLVGVTIAEMVRRGTVSSADLYSINWLLNAMKKLSVKDQNKINKEFTSKKMTELSDDLRNNKSIVQLICEM